MDSGMINNTQHNTSTKGQDSLVISMEDDKNDGGDRQKIEEYLKLYCIEEILDETINDIIERRPTNPYVEIAQLIEAKTMPEIIEVSIVPIIVGSGRCGVLARVQTNLGSYTGSCGYPFDSTELFRDYTVASTKIGDALQNIDPRDVSKVDDVLTKLPDIDAAVITAVSKACARAGARHRGIPLYKYLAEQARSDIRLPLPVFHAVGKSNPALEMYHMPTLGSNAETALENLLAASGRVGDTVAQIKKPTKYLYGCLNVADSNLDEIGAVANAGIDDTDEVRTAHAIDFHAKASSSVTDAGAYAYLAADGQSLTSVEQVERVIAAWKKHNVVSIEDPLSEEDITGLRYLKEKVVQTVEILRKEQSSEMPQALEGVGGEESVSLQIVADETVSTAEDIKACAQEAVFNAIKLRFDRAVTVSNIIGLWRAAREVGWAVILSVDEDCPETSDTFISDLAVALGVSQLQGGGVMSSEYSEKYNRLLEILRGDDSVVYVGGNTFRI